MKTIKTIRRVVAMMVIFFAVTATSCKKDNAFGPNGSGSFDERIMGTWQFQEISGSGSFTQTSVFELTFSSDGSGFQETFSLGPFGQTARKRTDYSWSASANKLRLVFSNGDNDAKYSISDGGGVLGITFENGNRIVYSRIN